MPRALTIGLRANVLLSPFEARSDAAAPPLSADEESTAQAELRAAAADLALDTTLGHVRLLAEHRLYAAHILTPRSQLDRVHELLTTLGIRAQVNDDPDRQFWNDTETVLVTDSLVQGDIRVGRGIVLYQGDWDQTVRQLTLLADGQPRNVVSRYDGVIHDRRGWQEGRLQDHVPGAPEKVLALLEAGHRVHIATQRPVAQLPEIADWLIERGVPAVASTSLERWDRTGAVLVTNAVLPAELEIENRAANLTRSDWGPVMDEIALRRVSLLKHFASREAATK
ncbi:hypothetical protein [Streptomyces sp. B29(2018)]|uniref:hypothetical protein n=1 Tax=Streptomyces sp. B29(2018) TaxID=2485016 RepID=UPI000FD66290|nr:hypothetical protein [Streptomyces sp. B29(2018)]